MRYVDSNVLTGFSSAGPETFALPAAAAAAPTDTWTGEQHVTIGLELIDCLDRSPWDMQDYMQCIISGPRPSEAQRVTCVAFEAMTCTSGLSE